MDHDLEKLSVKQLRKIMSDHNIAAAGKKAKLIEKIKSSLCDTPGIGELVASMLAETSDVQGTEEEPEATSGAPTDNTGEETSELEGNSTNADSSATIEQSCDTSESQLLDTTAAGEEQPANAEQPGDNVVMDGDDDVLGADSDGETGDNIDIEKAEANLMTFEADDGNNKNTFENNKASEETPQQETPMEGDDKAEEKGEDVAMEEDNDDTGDQEVNESKEDSEETTQQETPMDTDQAQQQKTDANKQNAKAKKDAKAKAKKWVYYFATKSKDKAHLASMTSVKLLCQQRKALSTERENFRVKAFPISLSTLAEPAFAEITKECTAVYTFFTKTVKEGSELAGHVTLTLKKKANLDSVVEKLKAMIKDGEVVAAASQYNGTLNEFTQKFSTHCTGQHEKHDNTTLLIPELPATVTEETLWNMFPKAWEILFFPKEGKNESFATVYFPNTQQLQRAVSILGQRPPVGGLSKIELIPMKVLTPDFLKTIQLAADQKRTANRAAAVKKAKGKPDNRNQTSGSAQKQNSKNIGQSPRSGKPQANRSGWFQLQSRQQNPMNNRPGQQNPMNRRPGQQSQKGPRSAQKSLMGEYSPSFDRRSQGQFRQQQGGGRYFPDQPGRQGANPGHLQVLDQLLTNLSDRGNSAEVAETLINVLSAQKQQRQPPHYQQQQRQNQQQQQGAPKRSHSPAASAGNKRQRFGNFSDPRQQNSAPQQAVGQVAGNMFGTPNPVGGAKKKRNRSKRGSGSNTGPATTGPQTFGPPFSGHGSAGPPMAPPVITGPPSTGQKFTGPPSTVSHITAPLTTGPSDEAGNDSGPGVYNSLNIVSKVVRASNKLKHLLRKEEQEAQAQSSSQGGDQGFGDYGYGVQDYGGGYSQPDSDYQGGYGGGYEEGYGGGYADYQANQNTVKSRTFTRSNNGNSQQNESLGYPYSGHY